MRSTLGRNAPIRRPRGTVIALAAVMLTFFMAFVALAIDLGVIAVAQAQLQTVADSAALAGARQLATDRRMSSTVTDISTEMTAARAKAIAIGQANLVLGHTAQINDNTSNSSTGDVVIGYIAPGDTTSSMSYATQSTFNSVKVVALRSSDHVGIVPAIFSRVMGWGGSTLSVTSTATVDIYPIGGFNGNVSQNAAILPIVLSQTNYNYMINGTGGDNYTYTSGNYSYPLSSSAANGISSGADGLHESVIYPVNDDTGAGNWGTINFGVTNNSSSILGTQVDSGITPTQMQTEFPPNGQVTTPHTFSGNTGISDGIKDNLTNIIGKAVAVPIYDTTTGNGNNATYHVIAYAAVRIVAVNMSGNPKYVIVQPAFLNDPTSIPTTTSPLPVSQWSQGGDPVVHLVR
jgi:Flp pilus assembly protein TadG